MSFEVPNLSNYIKNTIDLVYEACRNDNTDVENSDVKARINAFVLGALTSYFNGFNQRSFYNLETKYADFVNNLLTETKTPVKILYCSNIQVDQYGRGVPGCAVNGYFEPAERPSLMVVEPNLS